MERDAAPVVRAEFSGSGSLRQVQKVFLAFHGSTACFLRPSIRFLSVQLQEIDEEIGFAPQEMKSAG